jgi:hypothetical protein
LSGSNSLRFDFEEGEELLNELNKGEGVSLDLSRTMASEINQLRHQPEGVLLLGTEGTKTITIFLAPHDVVQGNGPVLVPTFDELRVVSMVSREFIDTHALACSETEDEEAAQTAWNTLLDDLFNKTLELAATNTELNSWLDSRPETP